MTPERRLQRILASIVRGLIWDRKYVELRFRDGSRWLSGGEVDRLINIGIEDLKLAEDLKGLPVHGYREQKQGSVDIVNAHKALEERCLRRLDELANDPEVDKRWLAVGRTHLEQAWMAINRSVFKPDRATLSEDKASDIEF